MDVSGQWLASIGGPGNSGTAIINLELSGSRYIGHAYYFEDNVSLPGLVGTVDSVNFPADNEFSLRIIITHCIQLPSRQITPLDTSQSVFPSAQIPSSATFSGKVDAQGSFSALNGPWSTNLGNTGTVTLLRRDLATDSDLAGEEMSWSDFKNQYSTTKDNKLLFRGQKGRWRLATAFHRTGRADMPRFDAEDLPMLARQLSSLTGRIYNLNDPLQKGALANLIQHHGYPTPLLDWTESPFIAAFFAFCDVPKNQTDGYVRIHVLDETMWAQMCVQERVIDTPFPCLTILRPLGIDNPRMIPQQSVTTFTNIADIEGFITSSETKKAARCWRRIDISTKERKEAMAELRLMGVTAAAMFPGIDGACKTLREYNFDR